LSLIEPDERRTVMSKWMLLTILLFSMSFAAVEANEQAEKEAVDEAKAWLALVDQGDYAGSWESAASLFKSAVTKDQWQQTMNMGRKPFGDLISRKVKSATYATSLPGAPDGEYVVIQFQTSFQNKKSGVETVTPMKDKDGRWHVSGYYIK
jgi:hypothetical protein